MAGTSAFVHAVSNPDLRTRFSANGRSFWTIDEGWDFFWPNPDGTEFIEGTATTSAPRSASS